MLVSGLDEAGKGPCLGPLVICIASVKKGEEPELKKMGVTDSKKLNAERREELYPEIEKLCEYRIRVISASELNERMGRESLNVIEAKVMGELASPLGGRVYIDLPEQRADGFLRKAGLYGRDVVAEHKADAKYPIVGAASILAKVTRDRHIEELKDRIGEEIGSGYTSDEKTVAALKDPEIRAKLKGEIRTKWSTMDRILHPRLTDF